MSTKWSWVESDPLFWHGAQYASRVMHMGEHASTRVAEVVRFRAEVAGIAQSPEFSRIRLQSTPTCSGVAPESRRLRGFLINAHIAGRARGNRGQATDLPDQ